MPAKQKIDTEARTISTEVDESLIPVLDAEPDVEFEDPDYDPANDKIDPETQGHDVVQPMGEDPGEES
jgi:hypothetical protein